MRLIMATAMVFKVVHPEELRPGQFPAQSSGEKRLAPTLSAGYSPQTERGVEIVSDVLVVGAGFFGAVVAERLAAGAGLRVTLIDKRAHLGGQCYSRVDPETGVECHAYGSHIFHTSNEVVWNYLQRFARFNGYRHVVHTKYRNRVYTMPINLGTINAFYGCSLEPREVAAFLQREVEQAGLKKPPANLEEQAVALLGRPLYEAFIQGYTRKQWEADPRQLPADLITRLPVRHNYNTRYYDDLYEGIPWDGYARLFERLLDHPRIELKLDTNFFELGARRKDYALVVYSGPLDQYFQYSAGRLEWRTLRFDVRRHPEPDAQGCAVMNYADPEIPFTRIHEFKHFHPERRPTLTTITYTEYSRGAGPEDEPYYPVNTPRNMELLRKYQALARGEERVVFGGRLGSYQYLDMDDAVAQALVAAERIIRQPP
ncbi:MAG: UDP-galactopyranose mutase [Kiritimatiellaeota bacterium]|nr:UDP-galactopyranose mutase [Kiritimatiellota bacterium]